MDPITTAALALRTTQELSEHTSLIIAAAKMVYKYLTAEEKSKPILNYLNDKNYQDKRRYDLLCSLRQVLGDLPKEWILDEKSCPQITLDFASKAEDFKTHVDAIDICTYPQRLAVSGIVDKIVKVFISLSHREAKLTTTVNKTFFPWTGYRKDSFEMMFFCDLAIWLCITLPRYDVKDIDTPKHINNWINYCEKVNDKVLMYRQDNLDSNSPKESLCRIIKDLKQLKKNVDESQKAASFHERMTHINTEILSLAKHTFNFQLLLIEDESNDNITANTGIDVIQFLEHYKPKKNSKIDPNLSQLCKTILGIWLAETLTIAGIKSSDFTNTKNINTNTISGYLAHDFSKLRNLKNSGHWPFARKDKSRAIEYFKEISDIYRQLLIVYYVHDQINSSTNISRHFGDYWAFNGSEGKKIIDVLLRITELSTQNLGKMIISFWNKFYEENYLPENNTQDNRDKCHNYMIEANTLVIKKISVHIVNIKNYISSIKEQIDTYESKDACIKKGIEDLVYNLKAICEIEHMAAPELQTYLSKPKDKSIIVKEIHFLNPSEEIAIQKEIIIDLSVDKCPTYLKAREYLNSFLDQKLEPKYISQNLKDTELKSNIQESIYNSFIKPYYQAVNNWNIFSFYYGIPLNKIEDFKKLYFFASHVMDLFYSTDSVNAQGFSQIDVNLIDLLLFHTINDHLKKLQFDLSFFYHILPFQTNYEPNTQRVIIKTTSDWETLMDKLGNQLLCKELESYKNALGTIQTQENIINELKQALKTLEEERQLLITQLAKKDSIIAEKDSIITEKDQENSKLREINLDQSQENSKLREINLDQSQENSKLREIISKTKTDFEEVKQKSNGNPETKKSKNNHHFSIFSLSKISKSKKSESFNEKEIVTRTGNHL